ncbi:hypothetical protein M2325_001285 [Methanococcus voltae PS]|uniref:Uncharacterized protein n=1 Tax=Methanococcus voltae PS TaxID=523842 RepID=A0ABT2EXA3_METVO|nr:hypothetical protein [Methanococcus voltae]MCS3922589.1 hypothetical protein [Methanococcus voltae PS]
MSSTEYITSTWIPKAAAAALGVGALLYWLNTQSVNINEVTTAFASLPFAVIVFIELLDKYADVSKMYSKIIPAGTTNYLIKTVITAIIAFIAVLYATMGTITLSSGSITVPAVISAAVCSLYILAPETGDDELLLYLWLGATVATFGANITLLPPIPGIPGLG